MVSSFVDWLVNLISELGYPGVALSMFVESFFAPIPSEIILPFSGFVASSGSLNLFVVIFIASLSAYVGTLPFYFIGRWGRDSVTNFLMRYGKYLFIKKDDIDRGFAFFNKYGNSVVFFGRLIPIVRTVISFPAGVAKMNFLLFTIYTLVGTVVWSSILATAGYYLGSNWGVVSGVISKYEKGIVFILVCLILLYIVLRIRSRSNRSN